MPLQGENGTGPKKSKCRAIWRKLARDRAFNQERANRSQAAGKPVSGCTLDCIRMETEWMSGRDWPNCISPVVWREVCDEMIRKHPDAINGGGLTGEQ